ncbi:YdcF family protein [Mesobacillus subterraneus]|uniref:YdcF family protein n=1 Tax=Mesobacillus subterraneus TaxID=285983 RepID=UPI00203A4C73|nr:YdcF family protein [Mesobacillus subterraneus]MCM3664898.1 YdcF family protein [Mesobacillus subterraneus]MCM3681986.1 YdcF family protein [Mesobacillus subterraneus]
MNYKFLFSKPLIITVVCGLLYVGFLHYKIIQHATPEAPKNADYIIVLGARVKGTVPSLALQFRIDHAAEYLKENPDTIAIASGGKGPGEDISEAESIKNELIAHGIKESRILLEDTSTTTYENIRFSKKLIPKNSELGLVVTNDFHIFRSKMIANNEGLELSGLPAKTPVQALLKSYVREYLALTKYFILNIF